MHTETFKKSDFYLIKGEGIDSSGVVRNSYVAADPVFSANKSFSFRFSKSLLQAGFGFVFGFQGIGCHYCVQIPQAENAIYLYAILDGQRIYLNHVRVRLSPNQNVEIRWLGPSIKVFLSGRCIINIWNNFFTFGKFGYHVFGKEGVEIPELTVRDSTWPDQKWFVFGDGFSNPRWGGYGHICWPDMVFDGVCDWFNFAVAACNSTRGLAILDSSHSSWEKGSDVVFAFGNDDLIESCSSDVFISNIDKALKMVHEAHKVYVLSLWPGLKNKAITEEWNTRLRNVTDAYSYVRWVDLNAFLSEQRDLPNYTEAHAQVRIAEFLAKEFSIGRPARVDLQSFISEAKSTKANPNLVCRVLRYSQRILASLERRLSCCVL